MEGSGKAGGVGVTSLLGGSGVGSVLIRCGAAGGDIVLDVPPLENLMPKLHQAKGKNK
jgi:hypothetical protein